jgi:hypothetical protein
MAGTTTATNIRYPSWAPTTASRAVPPVTTGTSPEYAKGLEELSGRAFAAEPLTVSFTSEQLGIMPISPAQATLSHAAWIASKLQLGAEIVEAGNWAAAACWEPPEAASFKTTITPEMRRSRPVFVGFLEQVAAARRYHMSPDARFWHLSAMARDPERKDKGAVRAVLAPYIARAKKDGVPIWIEASSSRARDIYAYFGFRVVEEIWSGVGKIGSSGYPQPGGPGVHTWLMIKDPRD